MRTKQEIMDDYRKILRLIPNLSKTQVKKQMANLHNLERELRQLILSKETIKEMNDKLNQPCEEIITSVTEENAPSPTQEI